MKMSDEKPTSRKTSSTNSRNDSTPTKPKQYKNWKWRQIFMTNPCCRRPNNVCTEICRTVWKAWNGLLAIIVMMSGLVNIGCSTWYFLRLDIHSDIFIGTKMSRMLILTPKLFPLPYAILNAGAVFFGLWTLTLSCLPGFGVIALTLCRSLGALVILGLKGLVVLQLVYGWGEWPDTNYVDSLEWKMNVSLAKQRFVGSSVDSSWNDTQEFFHCCGVNSYHDWFQAPKSNRVNQSTGAMRILPGSCCVRESDKNFCSETYSTSWRALGCLSPQIDQLKLLWLLTFISTLLLMLSLIQLLNGLILYYINFSDFPVTTSLMLEKAVTLNPSSSWTRDPPQLAPSRKWIHGFKNHVFYQAIPRNDKADESLKVRGPESTQYETKSPSETEFLTDSAVTSATGQSTPATPYPAWTASSTELLYRGRNDPLVNSVSPPLEKSYPLSLPNGPSPQINSIGQGNTTARKSTVEMINLNPENQQTSMGFDLFDTPKRSSSIPFLLQDGNEK